MLLSAETRMGLQMTGNGTISRKIFFVFFWIAIFCTVHSFIGIVKYVFLLPSVKKNKIALLSRNLCQDLLENYFGFQRQQGGTSDNPKAAEFELS